jgi:hypothetical protein
VLPHDGGEQPHKKERTRSRERRREEVGTKPKEDDDVSEREEKRQTGHGGGDPRDAIPHVRSGSCVSKEKDKEMLSRPVWVMHNREKAII